jgi:hypothetical protein
MNNTIATIFDHMSESRSNQHTVAAQLRDGTCFTGRITPFDRDSILVEGRVPVP